MPSFPACLCLNGAPCFRMYVALPSLHVPTLSLVIVLVTYIAASVNLRSRPINVLHCVILYMHPIYISISSSWIQLFNL